MPSLCAGIAREVREGDNGDVTLYIDDAAKRMRALSETQPGSVQLIYLDPPFSTGGKFEMRMRVGEKEWRTGQGSLRLPAYDDNLPREEYLTLMRDVLESAKALLRDTGLIFIHVDYRMHAYFRLLCDEIFGEKRFINEIIWTYETGGRAKNFFARKHDVILLYGATQDYDLHTHDVATVSPAGRKNHLSRHIDEDGRVYRTIKSNGKTYKYFDDEPVPPSDVWTDVSHLQQKDPQRLGYDTQKPLKLLERVILCASRKGDTVLDPFCGSCTTAEAAVRHGRKAILIDTNPMVSALLRRRVGDKGFTVVSPENEGNPMLDAEALPGIGYINIYLNSFTLENGLIDREITGLDAVDSWGVGTRENETYTESACETRSFKTPALTGQLRVPMDGETDKLILRVSDILGRTFRFEVPVKSY